MFDSDCLGNECLLTSEDTAIDMQLLKYLDEDVTQGACPFLLKAKVYNSVHGYSYRQTEEENGESHSQSKKKRYSRGMTMKDKLGKRLCLDRRRLEEAFLLYAVMKVHFTYDLDVDHIEYDRNILLENVVGTFLKKICEKWSGHRCSVKGCGSVLVLDGNMKNARTVCSCNNVGEMVFDDIGSVLIGCPNAPGKGVRYCKMHEGVALKFIDEENVMEMSEGNKVSSDEDLVIKRILNDRLTKQGVFFQVEWCYGKTSWIKESNLPKYVRSSDGKIVTRAVEAVEFGRKLRFLVQSVTATDDVASLKSSGFAISDRDDEMITEGEKERKLNCGTSKEKHKAKNLKTAGCLTFQWACGIVINVAEMFNGRVQESSVWTFV